MCVIKILHFTQSPLENCITTEGSQEVKFVHLSSLSLTKHHSVFMLKRKRRISLGVGRSRSHTQLIISQIKCIWLIKAM